MDFCATPTLTAPSPPKPSRPPLHSALQGLVSVFLLIAAAACSAQSEVRVSGEGGERPERDAKWQPRETDLGGTPREGQLRVHADYLRNRTRCWFWLRHSPAFFWSPPPPAHRAPPLPSPQHKIKTEPAPRAAAAAGQRAVWHQRRGRRELQPVSSVLMTTATRRAQRAAAATAVAPAHATTPSPQNTKNTNTRTQQQTHKKTATATRRRRSRPCRCCCPSLAPSRR